MEKANLELLEHGIQDFGVTPGQDSLQAIVRHLEMVAEWNERVNLTAITSEREMVLKHAVDSASALLVVSLRPGTSVCDVGPGAGFPGVVLKCLQPGIRLCSVESLQKRCRFLEEVGSQIIGPLMGGLTGYEVVWGRAEDAGHRRELREGFDVVVARAVAELRVLSEYCLPLCRVGGEFIALKGPGSADEVKGAEKAMRVLGGRLEEVKSIELPEGVGERTLIRIRKVSGTPNAFPRKAGTPERKPM